MRLHASASPPGALFNPTLRLFLLAMILANLGGSMFFSFYALFFRELGFEVETIGLYFTLASIFPLLFQIFGGWISDRIGRLKSIAFGSAAGAVSWIGLLLAPSMAFPLAWFLASDALGAVTRSLVAPSFDAFVAEQSEEKDRARIFGLVQSVYMVVGILGPPIGGFVLARLSFRVLMWMSAGLYWSATLIRIAMARRVPPAPQHPAAGGGAGLAGFLSGLKGILALALGGGAFVWILAVDGALDLSGKLSSDLLPLYLKEIGGQGAGRIGLLQGAMALASALAMIPMGGFADRRGERYPAALGCSLVALAMLLLGIGGGFPLYLVAYILFGLGTAAFQPAMQSLISKVVPSSLRGLAFGFLGTSLGIFSFFAPALGGFLWKRCFPALPFLLGSLIVALAAWIAFSKFHYAKAPTEEIATPAEASPSPTAD